MVAEKFQAMVGLGMGNSRLKDFFDLLVLAEQFPFDASSLGTALRSTFERRRTEIPTKEPLALTPDFTADSAKISQWKGFLKRHELGEENRSLEEVANVISEFLYPLIGEMRDKDPNDLIAQWKPAGPWDFTAPLEME
ncbi:MAG: nucleotidyl transferase AbiEii/AbiGii toxin family protein [Planctomycetota bacterium]|nr:nucleotidyl transferase AbiEii/AbiGii toxin family protein [Planctomycetota bacterium]